MMQLFYPKQKKVNINFSNEECVSKNELKQTLVQVRCNAIVVVVLVGGPKNKG